jgi:hypothetical protein
MDRRRWPNNVGPRKGHNAALAVIELVREEPRAAAPHAVPRLDAADAKCQAQICQRASHLTIRASSPAGSGPLALGVV